jgi:hypothetical protein
MILENNLKPATHYIEVYSDGETTNLQDNLYAVSTIENLDEDLDFTVNDCTSLYTVAIFKIRAK